MKRSLKKLQTKYNKLLDKYILFDNNISIDSDSVIDVESIDDEVDDAVTNQVIGNQYNRTTNHENENDHENELNENELNENEIEEDGTGIISNSSNPMHSDFEDMDQDNGVIEDIDN
eukprot:CAMPEP_0116908644 /NCGR_PEP_ID=MMETSP0467-20121206/13814_1 /TAXON_ID=283647 /ORGANISM="Mesodinium pulex, Strain SPMC105" /LENGTH=116 /DNA_ID=CAMNT_0004583873 /DNA_START=485 /DNA_END=835 /DNA_ORIENTATION=-